MAVATAPLDLSAEATNPTTAQLRWLTPTSDGGDAITGYFIERDLNDIGFATLVATQFFFCGEQHPLSGFLLDSFPLSFVFVKIGLVFVI